VRAFLRVCSLCGKQNGRVLFWTVMISIIFHLTAMNHNFFATFLNLDGHLERECESGLSVNAWCKVNKNVSINITRIRSLYRVREFSPKIVYLKYNYMCQRVYRCYRRYLSFNLMNDSRRKSHQVTHQASSRAHS